MQKKKIFFIGIIEEKFKQTKKYIEKLLIHDEWEIIYRNENNNILGAKKDEIIVIIICTEVENLYLYNLIDINFDIIIYNSKQVLDNTLLKCDYFIINSDDDSWLNLSSEKIDALVVSFGFNNKASITVSSYNADNDLSLNLYLQREMRTIVDTDLEPFEFTINAKTIHEKDLHQILAAATTCLILGNEKLHLDI